MAKFMIPITKWGESVEVDTDKLEEQLYRYVIALGLKQILNRGMSKITKEAVPDEAKRKAEAKEVAEKTLVALYENKIRMTGGVKPKTTGGALTTEAMRLARLAVKDMIKAAGGKVSHYDASEITKAAKELIEQDKSYREQAQKNLDEREAQKKPVDEAEAKAKVAGIAINVKKVAAAEAKKAERKAGKEGEQLSAKQAAKPKGKGKPPVVPAKKPPQPHAAH